MTARPPQVAAAVLLPPFGVYLRHGADRDFWIACGLTMLGFLPGVAFALWSVVRSDGDGTPAPV